MAATRQALQERATAPAPTRQDFTLSPGVELGILPTRAAKALAAAGLQELGIAARYIITDPHAGGGAFKVVTEGFEPVERITAARAFLRGLLFALTPPDPLAVEVSTARDQWARFSGRSGRAVQVWAWACGSPDCCQTATVRLADQGKAWAQLVALGWRTSPAHIYVCPDCAGKEGDTQ